MGLQLDDNKMYKVYLNGEVYLLDIHSNTPITNGVRLFSTEEDSEDFILKDANGVYITTAKDGE